MTANVQVDVHVFTAGSGGAGKTTALLNALCYFVERRDNDTSILIFDEGDNPDFGSMWMPKLKVQDLPDKIFGHSHVQLNMIDTAPIFAFEPKPKSYKGFRWSSLNNIISSYIDSVYPNKNLHIVVLVDTGGSPGSIFRNAGNLSSLNHNYNWKLYPWVLWTPNSLISSDFLELSRLSLGELGTGTVKHSTSSNQSVHVFNVFNPVIPDSSGRSISNINQLTDFFLPKYNRLALVETFLAYQTRDKKNEISIDDFASLAKFAFIEARSIDLSLPPIDVYRIIGRALNHRFIDKHVKESNNYYGYSNIFCNGYYDRNLAAVKHSPGILNKILLDLRETSFKEGDAAPVERLSEMFGEVYRSYKTNLDKYFSLQ